MGPGIGGELGIGARPTDRSTANELTGKPTTDERVLVGGGARVSLRGEPCPRTRRKLPIDHGNFDLTRGQYAFATI
jgi:hypothetical protein